MIDTLIYVLLAVFFLLPDYAYYSQLSKLRTLTIGTQAFVLYSDSVLYLGVRVISSPICVAITVIMLFDIKASRDII